jgi:hypothetical protein
LQVSADTAQIALLSSNTTICEYLFGDELDDNVGRIRYEHATNNLSFWTATQERLRIDSSGRVGIGTSSPSQKLHIDESASNSYATMRLSGTNRGGIVEMYSDASPVAQFGSDQSGNIFVKSSLGFNQPDVHDVVYINTSGNVGIGTTSPQQKQHIHENSTAGAITQYTNSVTGSGAGDGFLVGLDSTEDGLLWVKETNNLTFGTSNTERARIDSSGRVGIGISSPSRILQVKAPSANSAHIALVDNDSTNEIWQVGNQADGDGFMSLRTDEGTTAVQFDASGVNWINGGNVGIGTTSPSGKLTVNGSVTSAEQSASASSFDLATGNHWFCGAIAVPNPTNQVAGQMCSLRVTAAPTSFASNWKFPGGTYTAPTSFPAVAPFFVQASGTILVGSWTEGIA